MNKNSISEFNSNTCILIDPNSEAHNRYGAKGECIYLIRPDGYVGYRSLPRTWKDWRNIFKNISELIKNKDLQGAV